MYKELQFPLPQKPFKNEAEFTRWFWRMVHDSGGFWHKISDMSMDAKPSDGIIAINWLVWLVEIKVGKEKTKVDIYKKLRPCQRYGLSQYKKNWWTSIVIYYNQIFHQYRVMDYSNKLLLSFSK